MRPRWEQGNKDVQRLPGSHIRWGGLKAMSAAFEALWAILAFLVNLA